VFAGASVKTGFVSTRFVNFFVVARTMCNALGLPAFGEAVSCNPITDVWARPAASVPLPPRSSPAIALGPVVPNPFHQSVSATLSLASEQTVEAAIYDLSGRRVKSVFSGVATGPVQIRWDGMDESGRAAHPGIYMLQVRAGARHIERKMLLVR